jgi:two-component system, sensor histidine kinase and response regulator
MPASLSMETLDDLPPESTGDSEDKINILLVDDQPGKLLSHEAILSELGENIIKATNGREALECLLRQDFAVILLDVNMPDIDGFQMAELIRQRPRFEKTPIIFITGYNTTDIDKLKGYALGAVDYLYLPIIPEVLKAKVSVFVALARQTLIIKRQAEHLAQHNESQAQQLQVIQKLNEELREANRELEAFSYTISHDLRAPLRALKGYTDVLLEEYAAKLETPAQEALQSLRRAAIRMDLLTRDLLNYTRVVRQTIELEPVRIEDAVNEILSLNPALRPPAAEIVLGQKLLPVRAHSTLLSQCLANLLDNAVKFARPGSLPEVRVQTEQVNGSVRVWIEDNGLGIDPAYHDKIFGIFERVGDVKKHEGTGIGLAIVARAVQKMGGTCGVESSLGQGSRFWIELEPA